jgi:leucyl-tRNA synthetase
MVLKDGTKMSKSLGNVVDPKEIIDNFGPDTARLFMLFTALPEKELEWSDKGVAGNYKFLKKVYRLLELEDIKIRTENNNKDKHLISKLHSTIKTVTEYMDEFKLSLAIGKMMELVNVINSYKEEGIHKQTYDEVVEKLVLLLTPFTPHIAEELWARLGNKDFISKAAWPEYDENKIDKKAESTEELISQTIADINKVLKLIGKEKPSKVKLIISAEWKYKFFKMLKEEIKKTRDVRAIMSTILDEAEMKRYGKDISRLIPAIIKDTSKMPKEILDQKIECESLKDVKEKIASEFSCVVEIEKAEESKENKAAVASPGKPAILVE